MSSKGDTRSLDYSSYRDQIALVSEFWGITQIMEDTLESRTYTEMEVGLRRCFRGRGDHGCRYRPPHHYTQSSPVVSLVGGEPRGGGVEGSRGFTKTQQA